ncbi:MAG: hypothetical protein KY468_06610, partial [Armatimonadetes bacterium]|nr:hypothetical protein [Armatimonadota bacterium]
LDHVSIQLRRVQELGCITDQEFHVRIDNTELTLPDAYRLVNTELKGDLENEYVVDGDDPVILEVKRIG